MILLTDKSSRVSYHIGVLESRVSEYVALGWSPGKRDYRPSVDELIVLMSWVGDGEPPLPAKVARE